MMNIKIIVTKVLRRIYAKYIGEKEVGGVVNDPTEVNNWIYNKLLDDKPCMIARFGATELSMIKNYLGATSSEYSIWKVIQGRQPEWWWNEKLMKQMEQWSGFFPATKEKISEFCNLMLKDAALVDMCAVFGATKCLIPYVERYLNNPIFVPLYFYDSFLFDNPWSKALYGKKVLVIHPFAELIEKQYKNRERLFSNPDVLPSFTLKTLAAIQSLGGDANGFSDWFEALDWMKKEMDQIDYDIVLIGCGAYGFPLAAHAKRMGKKAVHLGGSLQLLFGIKGNRWENPNYGVKEWGLPFGCYCKLINNYWIKPDEKYKSKNSKNVEGNCYW